MKKISIIILFILLANLSFSQNNNQEISKKIKTFITGKINELSIKGLAYAIVKNGNIIDMQTYGYGNLEWKQPVTIHTSFQIASSTKLLTSSLVLKTLYEKRINLDDPIGKFIDSVPTIWEGIKIKHIISHTSGLRNFTGDQYITTDSVVKLMKKIPLVYPTGTNQQYQSSDYIILRYILEKIYQMPFEKLLKEKVILPAKMNDGGYDMERNSKEWIETQLVSQKATTYYGYNDSVRAYKYRYAAYTYAAGGYFASISDMANWAIALDKQILFPKSFEDEYIFKRDTINNKLNEFGRTGWIISEENGIKYCGHPGGPGLGDVLRFPEQGYTFIVLSNDGNLYPGLARAIASFFIKGLPEKTDIQRFNREYDSGLNSK